MQNITFSADKQLIEAARERARERRTTLNEEFRRWLADYACSPRPASKTLALFEEFGRVADTSGQKFTRDEMNARR